ncbi:hypothetical protein JXA27_07040 [Aerococcaceae bacterium zg-B36]|uniref:hypothetical protein n=1 Tax=Aerococcaceae bacterium zg-252 TaxID=2796928 RepID=UPI001BD8D381|nr:hypothetical protein [Aerococcaceae bacterium zg-B36]
MKSTLHEEIHRQCTLIVMKMKKIHDKYKSDEQFEIKDLEDIKRYSEILSNLGVFLKELI